MANITYKCLPQREGKHGKHHIQLPPKKTRHNGKYKIQIPTYTSRRSEITNSPGSESGEREPCRPRTWSRIIIPNSVRMRKSASRKMRRDWSRIIKPELKETIPEQLEVSVGPDIRRALYGAPRGSPTPSKRSDMMVSRPKIPRIMPRSRSIKPPEIK